MKVVLVLCLIGISIIKTLTMFGDELDFISSKTHQIVLADGVPEEVIDRFTPILYSWKPGRLELRNMCEVFECNFLFNSNFDVRKRFLANGCKNFKNIPCMNIEEQDSVYQIETTIYRGSYASSISLGNRTYGMIGDAYENSIIFEIGVKVVE